MTMNPTEAIDNFPCMMLTLFAPFVDSRFKKNSRTIHEEKKNDEFLTSLIPYAFFTTRLTN